MHVFVLESVRDFYNFRVNHTQFYVNGNPEKYCRMLQGEHSAILSTFIKLPFVFKIFVLSIFEWLLKAGFTVDII